LFPAKDLLLMPVGIGEEDGDATEYSDEIDDVAE
jgi:hypothetical protein